MASEMQSRDHGVLLLDEGSWNIFYLHFMYTYAKQMAFNLILIIVRNQTLEAIKLLQWI